MNQSDIDSTLTDSPYAPRPKPTPIPSALWNAKPTYCLTVNDEWVSHILGALEVLDQDDTWIGTEDERTAAREQVVAIKTALMQKCEEEMHCDKPIRLSAIGEVESYNAAFDVWNVDVGCDPREMIPLGLPPSVPGSLSALKPTCVNAIAKSIKLFSTQQLAGVLGDLEPYGWMNTFYPLGEFSTRAGFEADLAQGYVRWNDVFYSTIAWRIGAEFWVNDLSSAFDSTFWVKVVCHMWCYMSDDCTFTYANWLALVQAINDDTTLGAAQEWLRLLCIFLGRKGLTNLGFLKLNDTDVLDPATDCACG